MQDFAWMWILFGMFGWLLFVRPRRARLCQGSDSETYDRAGGHWRHASRTNLESELAQRDALIAKLEERVRVLERIATDDSARLRDEIDRLRD
jgi:hypothetical protein